MGREGGGGIWKGGWGKDMEGRVGEGPEREGGGGACIGREGGGTYISIRVLAAHTMSGKQLSIVLWLQYTQYYAN